MPDFDMPGHGATFEQRGGWVARHLATDLHLSLEQTCGIVGNCGFESGGFLKLQEISPLVAGSAGGYGWAQWTGVRRKSFMAWCAAQRLAPSSDQANYGYLVHDFQGAYAYVVAALKRQSDLGSCVFVVGRLYEAPAGTTSTHLPAYAERLHYAQRALAGAKASPVPVSPVAVSPAPVLPGTISTANPAPALDIAAVQRALNAWGIQPPLAVDGDLGPDTRDALETYQEDESLPVTGEPDPATVKRLLG